MADEKIEKCIEILTETINHDNRLSQSENDALHELIQFSIEAEQILAEAKGIYTAEISIERSESGYEADRFNDDGSVSTSGYHSTALDAYKSLKEKSN